MDWLFRFALGGEPNSSIEKRMLSFKFARLRMGKDALDNVLHIRAGIALPTWLETRRQTGLPGS